MSAGFDAAAGDPLGGYSISPAGYAALLEQVRSRCRVYVFAFSSRISSQLASLATASHPHTNTTQQNTTQHDTTRHDTTRHDTTRHDKKHPQLMSVTKPSEGRVVVALEGGYNLRSISQSALACVRTMLDYGRSTKALTRAGIGANGVPVAVAAAAAAAAGIALSSSPTRRESGSRSGGSGGSGIFSGGAHGHTRTRTRSTSTSSDGLRESFGLHGGGGTGLASQTAMDAIKATVRALSI